MPSASVPPPRTDEPPLPYIQIKVDSSPLYYYLYEGPEEEKELLKKFLNKLKEWDYYPDDIYLTYQEMTRPEALAIERHVMEYQRVPLTEKEIENIKKVLNCPTCPRYYCRDERIIFEEEFSCQCDLFLNDKEGEMIADEDELPTENLTPN